MGRLVILCSRLFPLFSKRPRLRWRGPLEQYDGARGREVNQLAPRRSTHSLPLRKEAISRHLSKQPRWFCRICCSSGSRRSQINEILVVRRCWRFPCSLRNRCRHRRRHEETLEERIGRKFGGSSGRVGRGEQESKHSKRPSDGHERTLRRHERNKGSIVAEIESPPRAMQINASSPFNLIKRTT